MATAYLKGCLRISCPVTNSPEFRRVLEARVPPELEDIAALDQAAAMDAYLQQLRGTFNKVRFYEVADTDISLFGKTENNLREFNFLLKLLAEQNVNFSYSFFLDENLIRKTLSHALNGRITEGILKDTAQWIRDAKTITGAHLHQHLQYTRTYLEITHSYHNRKNVLPRIAVVANDHSFAQVGFAAAMESFGVPVVYIQHAEVSKIFPPLDFAAAILRNKVSLETYQIIGPVRGRTFVVSRNPVSALYQRVLEPLPDQVVVGLYPTAQWELASLEAAISKLRHNPAVLDFFVKLHPRSNIKFTNAEAEYFRLRNATPDERHVGVAGNSSVVLDLLARGNPVYQLFDLDELQPDYYGFKREGLAPAVNTSDLKDKFWKENYYNEAWLQKLGRFEPSIEEDPQLSRRKLGEFFRILLKRRRRAVLVQGLLRKIGGHMSPAWVEKRIRNF
jgi:hypothetical protein